MTFSVARTWRSQVETLRTNVGPLDALTLEAILAVEADARVGDFLARHAGAGWRELGLCALRAWRATDGFWNPLGDKGLGVWCLILPVFAACANRGRADRVEYNVIDLLAIDPDGENPVSSFNGNFDGILGDWAAAVGGEAPMPIRLYRSPLDWLRAASRSGTLLAEPEFPICIAWPSAPAAGDLMLYAGEIVADDDEHAEEIGRQVKALRKAATPPAPKILVHTDEA